MSMTPRFAWFFRSRRAAGPGALALLTGMVATVALGVALGTCGGSSSNGPGGGLSCPSGATSNCTQAQLEPYSNCIFTQCSSQFQACYGPGFRSGTIGGACAAFGSCANKCGCNDSQCQAACGAPAAGCQSCLVDLSACLLSATCEPPACAGGGQGGTTGGGQGGSTGGGQGGTPGGQGGSGGGAATCADLLACCNAIADASIKTQCLSGYNSVRTSGDASCASLVGPLRAGGLCP